MRKNIGNLIFPKSLYCCVCGKYIDDTRKYGLCDHCIRRMNFGCSTFSCSPYFDYGFAAMGYGLYERRLIFNLKYNEKTYMAPILAEITYDAIYAHLEKTRKDCLSDQYYRITEILGADIIIPVPIHRERLDERGFNQAEKIARHLGQKLSIEVSSRILRRDVKTHTQRALSAEERRANMEGVFSLIKNGEHLVRDKKVIIFDDIYTTGATVSSCAKLLRENGAKKIYVLTALFAGNRHHLMIK